MNKICTSIKQSEKLIELGIDVNTADMFYSDLLIEGKHKYNPHLLESYGFKTFEETKVHITVHLGFIPAWSLSALLGLLYRNNSLVHFDGMYNMVYGIEPHYTSPSYSNPLSAAFEMICWLKKNNKL